MQTYCVTYLLGLEDTVELGSEHDVALNLELTAHERLLAVHLTIGKVGEGVISQGDNAVSLALSLALVGGNILLQVDGLDKLLTSRVLNVELEDSVGLDVRAFLLHYRHTFFWRSFFSASEKLLMPSAICWKYWVDLNSLILKCRVWETKDDGPRTLLYAWNDGLSAYVGFAKQLLSNHINNTVPGRWSCPDLLALIRQK